MLGKIRPIPTDYIRRALTFWKHFKSSNKNTELKSSALKPVPSVSWSRVTNALTLNPNTQQSQTSTDEKSGSGALGQSDPNPVQITLLPGLKQRVCQRYKAETDPEQAERAQSRCGEEPTQENLAVPGNRNRTVCSLYEWWGWDRAALPPPFTPSLKIIHKIPNFCILTEDEKSQILLGEGHTSLCQPEGQWIFTHPEYTL